MSSTYADRTSKDAEGLFQPNELGVKSHTYMTSASKTSITLTSSEFTVVINVVKVMARPMPSR